MGTDLRGRQNVFRPLVQWCMESVAYGASCNSQGLGRTWPPGGDLGSSPLTSVKSETIGAMTERDWCTGHLLQELRKAW